MRATVLRVEEQIAAYVVAPSLLDQLDVFASAPEGFKRLRELVLDLAVRGRLTDSSNTVASESQGVRPYALPNGWAVAQFGDCAEIIRGITFPASEKTKEPAEGRIGCLRTANIQEEIEWSDLLYVRESFLGRPDQIVRQGDLIMSMANSRELVGKVARVRDIKFQCAIGGFLSIIRGKRLCNDYLLILLRSPDVKASLIDSSTQTTNIANISLSRLRPLTVGVPPLGEQSRIVAKVEELMALIDRLEAKAADAGTARARLLDALLTALADSPDAAATAAAWTQLAPHLDGLLQSPADVDRLQQTLLQLAVKGRLVPQDPNDEPAAELLKRICGEKDRLIAERKSKRDKPLPAIGKADLPHELPSGWSWARFPEVGEFGRGKSKHRPRNDPALFSGGTYPLVQTGEVARAIGTITTFSARYNDAGLAQSRLWPTGTLCITIAANIADCAILGIDACFPDSVVGFIPSQEIGDARYFEVFMKTAKEHLLDYAPSTAQKNINLEILNALLIPLPPKREIQSIVAAVASLTALCDRLRERLAARRDLSGKLTAALADSALQ